MNLNWGIRIVILYASFVTMMLYLVFRCTRENIDLVSDDYYEKEIKYDKRYKQLVNARGLASPLRLTKYETRHEIKVTFPEGSEAAGIDGTLKFYKPDDARLDFSIRLSPHNGIQVIDTRFISRGAWNVQAEWESGGKTYFHEEKFVLK